VGSLTTQPSTNNVSSLLTTCARVVDWGPCSIRSFGSVVVEDKHPGPGPCWAAEGPSGEAQQVWAVPFTLGSPRPMPLCFSPMFVIGWCPGQSMFLGPSKTTKRPVTPCLGVHQMGLCNAIDGQRAGAERPARRPSIASCPALLRFEWGLFT
jgi:hypothetical protein